MRRILVVLSFLLVAAPAWSGAWLRETDTTFAAISGTAIKDPDGRYNYKSSFYAEVGYRSNLTLGVDLEESRDYFGHALVFARVPVADFGNRGRFAAEFGIGAHHKLLEAWAMYKLTISYGKGFQTGWGNGWIAVDAAWENRTHDTVFRKLDFTAGLSANRLMNPIMQIETVYSPDSSLFWTARPSVMIRRRGGWTTWVLGLEHSNARSNTGLKFSIWSEY